MKKVRFAGAAAAVAVGLLLATPAAGIASDRMTAEERSGALWNTRKWDFDALRAEGATGKGVKVAVIDQVLNPDVPELRGANVTVKGTTCVDPKTKKPAQIVSSDPKLAEHGTNVVSMLVGNGKAGDGGAGARGIAPDAEVWFYGIGALSDAKSCTVQDPTVKPGGIDLTRDIFLGDANKNTPSVMENVKGLSTFDPTSMAARAAIRDGADVISLSVSGGAAADWYHAVAEAQIAGVPIVVGTGNPDEGFRLVGGPGYMNGVVPISAVDSDGAQIEGPESGTIGRGSTSMAFAAPGQNLLGVGTADEWGPSSISGTSYATPLVAGGIALGLQKYPEASAFQVLQGLVRTTGKGAVHEPVWADEHMGYGYANPAGMLATDVAKFPNENPLFVTSVDDPRCHARDYPAKVNAEGIWKCAWSTGPFPPGVNFLKAVKAGEKSAVNNTGQPAWSPYSKEAKPGAPKGAEPVAVLTGLPMWAWAVSGVGVLVLIGAIVAIVAVAASKGGRARLGRELGAETSRSASGSAAPIGRPPSSS
ncbi:S8/S53 family peptidase [Leucobacter iarius]|uniref:S8 family serine peptidase n=1 Tax=Leucobacter iarius TaxID=333963 RepID=A0ABN2L5Z6_9MICO